jgi:hypothetical protein
MQRFAFFESLEIGVTFTLGDGREFTKISDTQGQRVPWEAQNSLIPEFETFEPGRIVFNYYRA